METSDDPILSIFGLGKDKDEEMPAVEAAQPEQERRTAAPAEQLSEQAKKRRSKAASLVTRDWSKPKLGAASMLGL